MATGSRGHQPLPLRPLTGTKALASKIFYKIFKVIILSIMFFLVVSTSLLINLAQTVNYYIFRHINIDIQRWINSWLQHLLLIRKLNCLKCDSN